MLVSSALFIAVLGTVNSKRNSKSPHDENTSLQKILVSVIVNQHPMAQWRTLTVRIQLVMSFKSFNAW